MMKSIIINSMFRPRVSVPKCYNIVIYTYTLIAHFFPFNRTICGIVDLLETSVLISHLSVTAETSITYN